MPGWSVAAILALVLAGCSSRREPLPAACTGDPATIVAALRSAPDAVALPGGTRLSTCVSRARTDGDLQSLGITFTRAADTLRGPARSDPAAAVQLGYLAGAVQAGAAAGSGNTRQLARRVEQLAALGDGASAASEAALRRGLRAGRSSG
ncbi:MAG TPA: hypothetical protein VG474_13740 [Solirubrobacteraceae bacterium]|nr:hypothetical protein [Solirubrobacteraceae bacterium]